MTFQSFGKNQVKHIASPTRPVNFSKGVYQYDLIPLSINHPYHEKKLKSYTILCLTGTVILHVDHQSFNLTEGDTAQIENQQATLQTNEHIAHILISGVSRSRTHEARINMIRSTHHKKVTKPWGHELWFNGEHPDYCLKEVMIKKGVRTSLQYHHFKEETNVLWKGSARLIYKKNEAIHNDAVCPDDLGSLDLSPLSVVHVTPGILHRFEALTDVLLYETSTPYLDDVIRVQDDQARQHGRILAEHLA